MASVSASHTPTTAVSSAPWRRNRLLPQTAGRLRGSRRKVAGERSHPAERAKAGRTRALHLTTATSGSLKVSVLCGKKGSDGGGPEPRGLLGRSIASARGGVRGHAGDGLADGRRPGPTRLSHEQVDECPDEM